MTLYGLKALFFSAGYRSSIDLLMATNADHFFSLFVLQYWLKPLPKQIFDNKNDLNIYLMLWFTWSQWRKTNLNKDKCRLTPALLWYIMVNIKYVAVFLAVYFKKINHKSFNISLYRATLYSASDLQHRYYSRTRVCGTSLTPSLSMSVNNF